MTWIENIDDRGISPVISVVLMVAITLILISLVGVTVFEYGGDLNDESGSYRVVETGDSTEYTITFDTVRSPKPIDVYVDGVVIERVENVSAGTELTITGVDENSDIQLVEVTSDDQTTPVFDGEPSTTYGSGPASVDVSGDPSEVAIGLSANAPGTVTEGDTFQVTGSVDSSLTVVEVSPGTSEAQVTASSPLSQIGFSATDESFTIDFSATTSGDQDIVVTAETENGDTDTTTVTVTVEEPFDPFTASPDNSVTFTSAGETCQDVSSYNTAVITASAGQGGKTDTAALGRTEGGEGGKMTVVADISGVTQLCGQVGQQGERDQVSGGYGGSGFTSGSKGGLNAGGGGGSTLVYDGADPNNYAIAAGGGGGAGGEYFSYSLFGFTTYPSKGGDGGSIGGYLGGVGGYGRGAEGSDGGVSAGPLTTRTVSSSTNEGDGLVEIELYSE